MSGVVKGKEKPEFMQPLDLSGVLADAPRGEWLALSSDLKRLITHNADLITAFEEAKSAGEPIPVMFKLPDDDVGIVA